MNQNIENEEHDEECEENLDKEFECVKKGFAVSLSLLILYLAIYGFDKRLSVIWLVSMPLIFIAAYLYDYMRDAELFSRGLDIDLYMVAGGPFTIIGFFASLILLLRDIRNEEYEESISEERNGDTRHDKSKDTGRKQIKKEPGESKKGP